MTRDEAISTLSHCGQLARPAVLALDTFESTPQWKRIHTRLNLLISEAEIYLAVAPGSLGAVHIEGGEPKT